MSSHNHNRWLFWAAGLLIVMNLASLATVFWQRHVRPVESVRPDSGLLGDLLARELGFSATQAGQLRELQDVHFRSSKKKHDEIRRLRAELATELSADQADTVVVAAVTEKIGRVQASIERSIFTHFQAIKELCNDEQQIRLADLFSRMMPPPPPPRHLPPDGHRPPPGAERRPPPPARR